MRGGGSPPLLRAFGRGFAWERDCAFGFVRFVDFGFAIAYSPAFAGVTATRCRT